MISASVAAFLLIYGADLVSKSTFTSPALQWPYTYLYLAIPVERRDLARRACARTDRGPARRLRAAARRGRGRGPLLRTRKRGRHGADRRIRRGVAAGHHGDRPDARRRADRRCADLRHLRGVPAAGRAGAAPRAAEHGQFARLPAARDPVLHAGGRHDECRRHHRKTHRARDHAGRPFSRRARARQRAHQHADGRGLGLFHGGCRRDRQDHGAGDGAARLSETVRRRAHQRRLDPRQHDSTEPRADHLRRARERLGRRAVRRHRGAGPADGARDVDRGALRVHPARDRRARREDRAGARVARRCAPRCQRWCCR